MNCKMLRATLALLLAFHALRAPAAAPLDDVAFAPAAGAELPLDASFLDEHARAVRLADFAGSRPAIVVPAYYGCSNLCTVVLRSLAASLRASGLGAGDDFDVVAVSIDPLDSPAAALAKKREIVGDAVNWHFLSGTQTEIRRLTTALGYRYYYDEAERQYAHGAGIAIVAPGGRIVRVLYGVAFPRAELLDALAAARRAAPSPLAASSGAARTWLLCFHYDPHTGRYSFAAMNAVRAAALAALLALAAYMAYACRRERGAQKDGER